MNELVQILKNTRQHLMTGVSHMIPFVVSGGILLAGFPPLFWQGARAASCCMAKAQCRMP